MRNIKEHYYCVLSERLLLFSIGSFAHELALQALDFLYEWHMLDNGIIKGNTRCLNTFFADMITEYRIQAEEYAKMQNMKLYFFDFDVNFGELGLYIKDSEKFSKKIYRFCKKYMCDGKIIPILSEQYGYKSIEFDGVKCLKLNGEQLEQILKKLNKKS